MTVIVAEFELPRVTVMELGPVTENEPAGLTVNFAVAEWFSDPLLPATVRVDVPVGVVAWVLTVKFDEAADVPLMVRLGGNPLKLAPVGKPLPVRFTVPVKPLFGVAAMV